MSGPVWRFESRLQAVCSVCLKQHNGFFVMGEIADNELHAGRQVCQDCYRRETKAVVAGEDDRRAAAPAYAHR